jgi:23S rRNA (uracil1939-C5)-methyltransferase
LRWTAADGVRVWSGCPPPVRLTESTVFGNLDVPAGAFFQVNPAVADAVVEAVIAIVRECGARFAIDLYCGTGLFTLAAARAGVPHVLGIESHSGAIRAARRNARKLGLRAVDFAAGRVEDLLVEAVKPVQPEACCILLDPPRRGLDAVTRQRLVAAHPRDLVYVACAPDTLARDLGYFHRNGYRIVRTRLFDMFPRTARFETVTHLRYGIPANGG